MDKSSKHKVARFLVGGQQFTILTETLESGPPCKLTHLYACAANKREPIAVDRPPDLFSAILALYQTSELHIPMTTCPNAFLRELQFWELGVDQLADCCLSRYTFLEHIYMSSYSIDYSGIL